MSVVALLEELLDVVGWHDAPLDRLEIEDTGIALATDWPVTANALAVLAAVGLASSALVEKRMGRRERVRLDTRQAGLAMASSSYLHIDGASAKFQDPFTGFYEAADGEWVFLHGNFVHLREGLLSLLGASHVEDVAEILRSRNAREVEADAIAANLCAAAVRTRQEWEREPQASALNELPLVELTRIADAPRRSLVPVAGEALEGLRVLDLSRVIAGPMAGRTLAENGAQVLLLSGPALPSIPPLVVDTGFGKRAAEIDLASPSAKAGFLQLAAGADIVLDAYRPGSLAGRGLGVDELAAISPHLVHIKLDAFGRTGPWAGRRGYDSLVQATMGFSRQGRETPANLPCQPLDYLTGYLAAFGAMVALIRQEREGGHFAVRLSLARTAKWMRDTYDELGPQPGRPDRNPTAAEIADLLVEYPTGFGTVRALKPALRPADWRWPHPPVALGTHTPRWW